MFTHDVLRARLLRQVIAEEDFFSGKHLSRPVEQLRTIPELDKFTELMRNRLVMGSYRYGDNRKNTPGKKFCLISALCDKLRLYADTGNTELLVDAANYCMLEFEYGTHEKKHFQSLDDVAHAPKKGLSNEKKCNAFDCTNDNHM